MARNKLYVGRTLREGPKPLEDLCLFFRDAGYTVFMPVDGDITPLEMKSRDRAALRACDLVIREIHEPSLGVPQELGVARAMDKPVILITEGERVRFHKWIRGDPGIHCCETREVALALLKSGRPRSATA